MIYDYKKYVTIYIALSNGFCAAFLQRYFKKANLIKIIKFWTFSSYSRQKLNPDTDINYFSNRLNNR